MVEDGTEGKVLLENNGNYEHPIQNGGAPVSFYLISLMLYIYVVINSVTYLGFKFSRKPRF